MRPATLAAILLTAVPVVAAAAPHAAAAPASEFGVAVGAAYWDGVREIGPTPSPGDPTATGRVESLGYAIELSYARRLLERGLLSLWGGGELGLLYHPNERRFGVTLLPSGRRIDAEVGARLLYLTPSLSLRAGRADGWRGLLGAGAGYYLVTLAESLSDGLTTEELLRSERLGGGISLGVDTPRLGGAVRVRLVERIHLVDFGSAGAIGGGRHLRGPIFSTQVAVVYGW